MRQVIGNLPLWAVFDSSHLLALICGVFLPAVIRRVFTRSIRANERNNADERSLYGLDHGRLHLKLPDDMWMNMGYWKGPSKTLSEACRDLLIEVFGTVGVNARPVPADHQRGIKKSACVIDLGFGCGDQITCLMGTIDPRKADLEPGTPGQYTGEFGKCFENYVGITLDKKQYQFAVDRVGPASPDFGRLQKSRQNVKIDMFCADAGKPEMWKAELKACVQEAVIRSEERWVLALDTAYHFSPSRWPVIKHACQTLGASFAAFDLCLSPTATLRQKLLLRVLTSLMGAPWANFVTPDEYRVKLIEAGYEASGITIRDISEDVFGPLAAFLEQQERDLRIVGLGIGPFNVARLLFQWWARSGVVRGVIVVAGQEQK
ncbi:hypothetical protein BU23DRAFT_493279 [Bimuria novae-zelandiae CBS 107.79]|uniref:S-adenosyl-L-methionine-dependent methyltransferase n=1 Tax=Bimuria novae-zelandiae CBS 107.79 TaxID=1447943 RepID=A0A6A5UH44_9PLEO|nr:hypothetical protein BU23DRAFT_493279 [Bimuria novae-zelandiae CBS 107.79]